MTANAEFHKLEGLTTGEMLQWAWSTYGTDAVFTSSFGPEDMVITDMMAKGRIGVKIATIDTGRLPQETYELMDRAVERYGIDVDKYFPDYEKVEEMVNEKGVNLFYRSIENRKLCCNIRKVQPLNRILEGKKAWITGLRADQTSLRKNANIAEIDSARGIVKINPLLHWTSDDVWNYLRENSVPYNALHDQGYPSIGCQPCTRAIKPGEDERAGRWWWESDVKECGLHTSESNSVQQPQFSIRNTETAGGR